MKTYLSVSTNKFVSNLRDSRQTQKTYETGLGQFLAFLNERYEREPTFDDLYDEVLQDFDQWLLQRGLELSTRNTYLAAVQKWLDICEIHQELPSHFKRDRARLLRKANTKRGGYKIPDTETISHIPELVALFENKSIPNGAGWKGKIKRLAALRDRAFVLFLNATACRQSEARFLKLKQIGGKNAAKFNEEIKIIGKGGKSRILIFDDAEAQKALREYLQERTDDSEHVFISHDKNFGAPISGTTAWNIYNHASNVLDVHLSPHDTRHYCAWSRLNKGMPAEAVQAWLGHTSMNTTIMIYAPMNTRTTREWLRKTA